MSAPTMRELCAKATPGPWEVYREPHSGKESAMISISELTLNTPNFCGELFLLSAPNGLCPATTGCGKDSEANAQLIARLSPEVVLATLDALEKCDHIIKTITGDGHSHVIIDRALRLLNGEAAP